MLVVENTVFVPAGAVLPGRITLLEVGAIPEQDEQTSRNKLERLVRPEDDPHFKRGDAA